MRTVKNFVLGLETGWLFPRCCFRADRPGVQKDPAHDVMAKVRTDWAKLARKDARREKARRAEWDK